MAQNFSRQHVKHLHFCKGQAIQLQTTLTAVVLACVYVYVCECVCEDISMVLPVLQCGIAPDTQYRRLTMTWIDRI